MDEQVLYPVEFFLPLGAVWNASQAGWDVPEADVGVLGLQADASKG